MGFKVVNSFVVPDIDYGEQLLEPLDVVLTKGFWVTEDELIDNAKDADAIICTSPAQDWTPRVIQSLTRCRLIATISIGYDRIPVEAATEACIAVTNVPDYGIDEVASQAIALAMALSRKIVKLNQVVRETQIQISPGNRKALADILHPILRTQDQTMGIIGMGRIGTSVALKARGLGMRVIAYDPYVFGAVMRSHGVEPVDYDTLLKESDIISINADLNDETRHMVGEKEFKKMKPTSYLVNTARGGIVNQEALVRALKEGTIAGAGLDVTEIEPIPADDPILQAPNVIFTGHSAWYSTAADSPPSLWHKATAQTVMALKGEFPTYTVNPDVKRSWIEKWGKKA